MVCIMMSPVQFLAGDHCCMSVPLFFYHHVWLCSLLKAKWTDWNVSCPPLEPIKPFSTYADVHLTTAGPQAIAKLSFSMWTWCPGIWSSWGPLHSSCHPSLFDLSFPFWFSNVLQQRRAKITAKKVTRVCSTENKNNAVVANKEIVTLKYSQILMSVSQF